MNKSKLINILLITFILILLIYNLSEISKIVQVTNTNSTITEYHVPIIMYHHVKNTQLGKDVISQEEFENDLKYLSDNNYNTITMTQLIDYVYDDSELPPNPIILTFDDGLLSTYLNVFPLLQKYNMKIVLSIVGLSTEKFTNTSDINVDYSHATWNQIAEMNRSGLVEIQNHTYDMHSSNGKRYGCSQMENESFESYEKLLTEDVTLFNERINLAINNTPNTFTYPYGKYNDNTEKILKNIGFKATLTVKYGMNIINKNKDSLFELKRICRSHNNEIGNLLKEGMKTISH